MCMYVCILAYPMYAVFFPFLVGTMPGYKFSTRMMNGTLKTCGLQIIFQSILLWYIGYRGYQNIQKLFQSMAMSQNLRTPRCLEIAETHECLFPLAIQPLPLSHLMKYELVGLPPSPFIINRLGSRSPQMS